jgi:hypothetical protein
VRVCAALLLRAGRVGEALELLKAIVTKMPTMHAFLAMFEVASRLPPPSSPSSPSLPSSSPSPPPLPPLRFSAEHMLEVLETALGVPQHGLASEGNLLRWQLQRALRFGQAQPALAPPLACPPTAASAPLERPKIVIVMPFVAAERSRLVSNLGSWRDGGGL